jgi:transcriptional regulator with XRE-family HTH domain
MACFDIVYFMKSAATDRLPPASLDALAKLGADLAVARLRRRESLASWAARMGVSVPTLMNMEAGEPSVSIGIYLTALWLIGKDLGVGDLAAPQHDSGAIELEVREAVELGKTRARDARAAAQTRRQRRQAAHEQ